MRTYGRIRLIQRGEGAKHATWSVDDLEPHVSIRFKQMFPRISKASRPPFVLSGGPLVDADLRWFMDRYPLAISDDDLAVLTERKALFDIGQSELGKILSRDWAAPTAVGFRAGTKPYDYQLQAAELCRRTGRLLLVDELGLGKTVSAIATILEPDLLPALVVPQTHLPTQWAEKIAEFTELRSHIVKGTTPYELPPADVYIMPYSRLAGWVDYAEQGTFKSVVFDEIQDLRGGESTSKGAAAAKFAAAAQLRMGLSGTPIYNYGEEIWRVLQFIEPNCIGEWWDFVREWCTMGPGGKWLVTNPQALGSFLREQHLMLRRTRSDVGHERKFPNVMVHDVEADDAATADEAAEMANLARTVISGAFVERGQAAREFDMRMRHATGVAKARGVARFVRMLLESGEQVLLTGWHRDVYDIWLNALAQYNPVLYTGTESTRKKDRAKEAFISGAARVMIMSLRSGAGLDGLQDVCSTIVIGELDWSPKVHEQIIGRLDRPGQKKVVDAIYCVTDFGSDPTVMGVLGVKSSQSHGIVDPLSEPAAQSNDTTRIRQLAEQFLASNLNVMARAPKPEPKLVAATIQLDMLDAAE